MCAPKIKKKTGSINKKEIIIVMLRRCVNWRSVFGKVPMGPPDPILGLSLAFTADTFPTKVNLGAGVYRGDDNKPFVLECIKRVQLPLDFEYAPIVGVDSFVKNAQGLAFTPESAVLSDACGHLSALGGTEVRIGADCSTASPKAMQSMSPTQHGGTT